VGVSWHGVVGVIIIVVVVIAIVIDIVIVIDVRLADSEAGSSASGAQVLGLFAEVLTAVGHFLAICHVGMCTQELAHIGSSTMGQWISGLGQGRGNSTRPAEGRGEG